MTTKASRTRVALTFVACAVPLGLLSGYEVGSIATELGADGQLWGTTAGVLIGATSGLMGMLFLTGLHKTLGEHARGVDVSPHQRRELIWTGTQADLTGHVQAALAQAARGRPVQTGTAGTMSQHWTTKTSMSWRTFGERLSVTTSPCTDGCALGGHTLQATTATGWHVQVSSQPLMPTTLLDYGAGRRNVESVTRVLESAGARQRWAGP